MSSLTLLVLLLLVNICLPLTSAVQFYVAEGQERCVRSG